MCIHVCVHVRIYANLHQISDDHVCVSVYVCIYISVTQNCMYVCIYVCMHACSSCKTFSTCHKMYFLPECMMHACKHVHMHVCDMPHAATFHTIHFFSQNKCMHTTYVCTYVYVQVLPNARRISHNALLVSC